MKQFLKQLFTQLGLLKQIEFVRFKWMQYQNSSINKAFVAKHPNIAIPDDFYLYETFGLNYERYYYGGRKTAEWILASIKEHLEPSNRIKILDWGCGPARVLRHLPELDNAVQAFGSDYNKEYVKWCQKNLQNVEVQSNLLEPPLAFEDNYFDALYSISIFTHLSLEMHIAWMHELKRVTKKGSVLLITTHGVASTIRLNAQQRATFEKGELTIQHYKVEGNRLYAAYQPPAFFSKLSKDAGFDILEHQEGKIIDGKLQQDVWILRNR